MPRISLTKIFPFLRWGKNINQQSFQADMLAGITGAAIVLPQGVAFATIAGMPPEYGLYASMVPAIIAALFGSSWHLVSGPTTAASIVMLSALSGMAVPGSSDYIALAITLSFMVGVLQLVLGFAKMGTLVNFISHSVIVGFTAGAACLIAAKQVKGFFGIEIPDTDHFYETVVYSWDHRTAFHPSVAVVGFTTLLVGIFSRIVWPKIPSMILALLAGSMMAFVINQIFGPDNTGIKMVGALPSTLPPLSSPTFSLSTAQQLVPIALAMTFFALTEAVSIARSLAVKSGQALEPNQEFIGQGLSNIAGSFFSAYVATGSFNRSAANYDAGAVTPLAAITAGLLLFLLLPTLAPLTEYLPISAVAGLLFLVAWRLIDFKQIMKIANADEKEAMVMVVTFISTIFLRLEDAILLGVLVSLLFFLRKTSKPKVTGRIPDPDLRHRKFGPSFGKDECPQLKILRLDESLYFGSVAYVGELLRLYREKYPEQKHLLMLTKGINQVDVAGAELLQKEAIERRKMGGELYFYRLKDSAMRVLNRGGYMEILDRGTIYETKEDAIAGIFENLDRTICQGCDKRVFNECHQIEPMNTIQIVNMDTVP